MPAEPMSATARLVMTMSLSLATFMNVLDTSIANVAIPSLAGDLGVAANQGTWVITSFAVSNAIAVPLTGWLAKRVGEVRLFLWSTLLFTIASFLCGLSLSLSMLVAFRVVQGAVAGPMIPLSQSLLLANYPKDRRGLALSFLLMTVVVAPIFGPILGGWITDNISWPWIFYINVPVGLMSSYVTWVVLRDRETERAKPPIDTVGLILLAVGVGCLQVVLDKGNELDWFGSQWITSMSVIAGVALVVFVVWELTELHPVVDLSLFKKRNFTVGTVAISLGYLVYFGGVVLLPLWLQTQMGYTATWAGIATAPRGVLALVLAPLVGRFISKGDLRWIVSFSFLVFAVVFFWSAGFDTTVSIEKLVMPGLLQGIGTACFFAPLSSMLLSGLPESRLASASGLSNFLRILAGSFGASLTITFWDRRAAVHHSQLMEQINAFNPIANFSVAQLHGIGVQGNAAFAQLERAVTNQAYMLSTNDLFWISGWIFLALLALVWLAKPPFSASDAGGAGH